LGHLIAQHFYPRAWLKRRAAAINLRTLLGRGLTRHDGAWVQAT
jgi:hypothetical protein